MAVSWFCRCIAGACDTGVWIPESVWVSESDVNACLVGVRLVRALRLAVSVITMVCGRRPVCVYWATSDLGP